MIKLPKLQLPNQSDGTVYIYMDTDTPQWTYLTGITTEQSAVGHTVAQMYAPTESYNNVIENKISCTIVKKSVDLKY